MEMERNELFPVFLKLNQLKILLVGAGPVGLEKLTAIIFNAPKAFVKVVAMHVLPEIGRLAEEHENITIENRPYHRKDMMGWDIAIVAVNNRTLSEEIYGHAKSSGILVNVADTPDLCDFYLGSIIQKGHLKIAISTNGKSPTMAKRMREWLTSILPESLDPLLNNLYQIRQTIRGDFEEKVKRLDAITSEMVESKNK
jgi:siroheme synthase-like protein